MANAPFDKTDWNPLNAFAEEVLTVGATSVPFTAATRKNAKLATAQVQVAPIRSRMGTLTDPPGTAGTDPTATVGELWNVGDLIAFWGNDCQGIEFIAVGASATLFCRYYR